jgi:uncharacterized DUF497 family protein
MEVEFDPKKDEANIAKHGVPLLFGVAVLNNVIGEKVDRRWDYGEERVNAFGVVNGKLFVCTYTMRGTARRFISVRIANKRERQVWLSLK